MNTIVRPFWLIAICLITFASLSANAESRNFAHVNTSEILREMPRVQEAEREMRQYTQQLEQQLEAMSQEFQRKLQEYQQEMQTMTNAMRQDRERELGQLQERVENFQMEAQQEMAQKEQELLEPILEEVEAAISRVAEREGFDYVFDTSGGSVLHAPESDNIKGLVRDELGLN